MSNNPHKEWPIHTISALPGLLPHIYKKPPLLYVRGTIPLLPPEGKYITIIGPRKPSSYAYNICTHIIASLKGLPVCIVSGLAYGIDAHAHSEAIKNNIPCIAFPGSGIDDAILYPRSNIRLAHTILERGGALLCEWEPSLRAAPWTFIARNRLMAGISHSTIIIEAGEKSGTLITARFALTEGRDVFVVPADITRTEARGSNTLIQQGAHPITCIDDIPLLLGFTQEKEKTNDPSLSLEAITIIKLLSDPHTISEIHSLTNIPISTLIPIIQELELDGKIIRKGSLLRTSI